MLRVICEDLLYHETPVAMSSVVCMNIRRIVMRPHVQRMLHNLAVGHRSAFTRLSLPFSGPSRNSYSLCCAAVVRRSTLWAKLSSDLGSRQVLSTGCRLFLCACGSWFLFPPLFFLCVCLFVFSYALLLSRSVQIWNRKQNFDPKLPNPAAFMPGPCV